MNRKLKKLKILKSKNVFLTKYLTPKLSDFLAVIYNLTVTNFKIKYLKYLKM